MELNASDLLVSFTLASDKKVLRRESALIANFERDELKQHVAPTAHPKQNNIPGLFWMSQLNQMIWYSSRLEMFALKQIDFDQQIKAILPKPFELTFKFEGERLHHTPRYLIWLSDGKRLLLNVRSKATLNSKSAQTAKLACCALCEDLGWQYIAMTNPDPIFLANLNWLAGYRRKPPNFQTFAIEIVSQIDNKIKIKELLSSIINPTIARPTLFHLMWMRILKFDMNQLLNNDTEVWIGEKSKQFSIKKYHNEK